MNSAWNVCEGFAREGAAEYSKAVTEESAAAFFKIAPSSGYENSSANLHTILRFQFLLC
jgi:hypothetical protein